MIAFRAPGRVNLIGEHVDYAGGLVLPVALEQAITVSGSVCAGEVVQLLSAAFEGPASISVASPEAGQTGWARYAAAVVAELREIGVDVPGFRGTIESDLPVGAGLSSSAALEVALAGVLSAAAGHPLAGLDLALLAQRAEQRAVGVPCGIMDQAASALAREGHALLLDCASLEYATVPLPDDLRIVVVDSGVRRRLEDTAYASRRREVELALAAVPMGASRLEPEHALALAADAGVEGVALRRFRHVVTENRRVRDVVAQLRRPGGPDRQALGRLFAEGHASLRDDFEVSTAELDLLVELAEDEGAIAARMTGGGFGGSIVALAPVDRASEIAARVERRYEARTGLRPTALTCRAGHGGGLVDGNG